MMTLGSRETGGFVSQSLELRARPGEDVYLPCHPRTSGNLPEPVFLNVYGAQVSIPRNEFRQPM
jgi:hypothetical protein